MRVLFVSLIVVIIDQVSKLLVKGFSIPSINLNFEGFFYGERVPLIGDLLSFTFVENPGIAFGINFGSEFKILISIFTILASIGLLIYFFKIKNKSIIHRLSIAFVIGGAVGNLIDRVFYGVLFDYAPILQGKVVDFIDFRILNLIFANDTMHNYIFNVADISVTVGMVLLMFSFKWNTESPPIPVSSVQTLSVENKD